MASLFTKILAGELPGHFVWKDEVCFSIMTLHPIRQGHLILIPNAEINHWDDVPSATAAHLMQVAQHLAKGVKAVIPCKRVGVMIVGLEVPHTHIHLIPADSPADFDFKQAREMSQALLAETAANIRKALIAAGHKSAQF